MKSSITPNLVQQWRVLFAVALALAALVCLFSLCSGLPTAEARGPATANTGSLDPRLSGSNMITSFIRFQSTITDHCSLFSHKKHQLLIKIGIGIQDF